MVIKFKTKTGQTSHSESWSFTTKGLRLSSQSNDDDDGDEDDDDEDDDDGDDDENDEVFTKERS